MAGQFNKKELELLMGEITRSEPNITPDQYRNIKGMEEMKPGSYPFRFMKEAPSENQFMKLLEASIKDTKPEGVMTAGNTRIIELNSLIDPDMDPGDLRTIYDDMMRESGGNYPGVDFDTFLKSIGTRTASNDEAVRQLENLFEMFKEQGMSDEEAAKAARERMENAPVRKAADGGIMYLAPGGPVTKGGSTLAPSTYGSKPFEDYLKDLGFTKVDEKTGKVRGSKGAWNKFLAGKGIKINSTQATNLLNTMLKDAGKRPYISVDMSQKGLGQGLIDEITGTEAGKPNVRDIRQSTANKIEEIRLDANDKFGRNPTKKKYQFIKDQIIKFFPKVAGTTALAQFIAGKALGFAGAFMPSEADAATLYDDEGNMKEGIMSQIEEQNKMKVITE